MKNNIFSELAAVCFFAAAIFACFMGMATTATAQELERGVVDVETLTATNEMLLSTIDDVMKIQEEGRAKRRDAEIQLQKMEADLKSKLIEVNQKRMTK